MNDQGNLWPLRLMALAVALVTWFFISYEPRQENILERAVTATVTYNTPRGLIVLDPVQTVDVRLSGSEEVIRDLNPFQVDLQVDLRQVGIGNLVHRPEPGDVTRPEGLEVVSIAPNVLNLQIDREINRTLPVDAELVGEPAAGAVAEEPQVVPSEVLVSGPESRLRTLVSIRTQPIRLDGHALDFEETVAVVSPDPLIKIIEPSAVVVRIPMRPPGLAAETGQGGDATL